jgi:hypothetical protein
MSAWTPNWFDKGILILHNGKIKTVKDWYFTSDGTHNGDIICIQFTDGTECEGWQDIEQATPDNMYVAELKEL